MVSDGVFLYLAYLTLVFGPEPAPLLLIEEPETGIHPGLLRQVVENLKRLTCDDPGVQVVLTTHSPLLLNYVEPEEIRILIREPVSGTKVHRFTDAPELAQLLEYQGPGEIWVNLSEKLIVGGR